MLGPRGRTVPPPQPGQVLPKDPNRCSRHGPELHLAAPCLSCPARLAQCHGKGVHAPQVPWRGPQRQWELGAHREPVAAKSPSPWAGVPSHCPQSAPVPGLPASPFLARGASLFTKEADCAAPAARGPAHAANAPSRPVRAGAAAHTGQNAAGSRSLGSQHNRPSRLVMGRRQVLTPRCTHGLWGH